MLNIGFGMPKDLTLSLWISISIVKDKNQINKILSGLISNVEIVNFLSMCMARVQKSWIN
jgi:hypothetical protein